MMHGLDTVAELLVEGDATREYVPGSAESCTRWHEHDWPSPYARWNYHPEYEVHLIRHTSGRYIVGDRVGVFEPGQLVLVGPYLPHNWVTESAACAPLRDAVFQFHDDWIARCQPVLPEIADLDRLLGWARRGVLFTGATATRGAAEMELIGRSRGVERVSHIFALLAILGSAPADERELLATDGPAWLPDPETEAIVNRVLRYVFDNLSGEIRLSAAASVAGMSDAAFSRFFAKVSGQSFSGMIRKLRLAQARKLLRQSNLPVAAIATQVGYRNLSNFNRQFLGEVGMTPLRYRRERLEPAGLR